MKKSYLPEDGIWLKANIHSHSTVSDGRFEPKELAKLYADKGYDVLCMTDHNAFVCHNAYPDADILLPTATEHDIAYSPDKCIHVVGIGAKGEKVTSYDCRRYTKDEITDQQLIDMMKADGQFLVLAHPVWSRMTPDEIMRLKNYDAIEVFNNGAEHLCHHGYAENYWEVLLQQGKRIWGIACDDVHGPDDLFGGWLHVKAADRTTDAFLDALHAGHFYASSGPEIKAFYVEDGIAHVECSPCREIHFVSYEPRGKSFFAEEGSSLSKGCFTLKGREKYVRVVCVDAHGHSAWSQPIFFD